MASICVISPLKVLCHLAQGDFRALNIKHDREPLYHVISLALPADITNIDLKHYFIELTQLLCFVV